MYNRVNLVFFSNFSNRKSCHFYSGFISIPPLLGWKKDPDLGWFEDIREYQKVVGWFFVRGDQSLDFQERNLTDFEFVDYLHQNLEEEHFNNFTASLVDSVFPKCQVYL